MGLVFIPTVQHSGTHFMVALAQAALRNKNCTPTQMFSRNGIYCLLPNGRRKNEEQATTVDEFCSLLQRVQTKADTWLVYGHIGQPEGAFIDNTCAQACLSRFKAITPLRDPLAVLVSTHVRIERPCFAAHVLDGLDLCIKYATLGTVQVLPLDVPTLDKQHYTGCVLKHAGLPSQSPELAAFLSKWEPVSSVVKKPELYPKASRRMYIRRAYDSGDLKALEPHIPELVELRLREDVFRPWLETFGYKDLLWWS